MHVRLDGQGDLGGALGWQVVGSGEQGLGNLETFEVGTFSAETSALVSRRLEQGLGVKTAVLGGSRVQVLGGLGSPRVQLVGGVRVGIALELSREASGVEASSVESVGVKSVGVKSVGVETVGVETIGVEAGSLESVGIEAGSVAVSASVLVGHVQDVLRIGNGVGHWNRVGNCHGLRNWPVDVDDLGNGNMDGLLDGRTRNEHGLFNGNVLDDLAVHVLRDLYGPVHVFGDLHGAVHEFGNFHGAIHVLGNLDGTIHEFGNLDGPVNVLGDWTVDVFGDLNGHVDGLLHKLSNLDGTINVLCHFDGDVHSLLDDFGNFNGTIHILGDLHRAINKLGDLDGAIHVFGDLNGVGTVNVDNLLLGNSHVVDLGSVFSDHDGTGGAADGDVLQDGPGGDAEGGRSQCGGGEETTARVHERLRAGHQQRGGSGGSVRNRGQRCARHGVGGGGDREGLVVGQHVVVAVELSEDGGGDESLLLVDGQTGLGEQLLLLLDDGGGVHDGGGRGRGQVRVHGLQQLLRSGGGVQKGGDGGDGQLVLHGGGDIGGAGLERGGLLVNGGLLENGGLLLVNRSLLLENGGLLVDDGHGVGDRGDGGALVGVEGSGLGGVQMELGVVQIVRQLGGDGRAAGGGDVVQRLADVSVAHLGGRFDADGQVAGDAAGGGLVDGGGACGVGLEGGDGAVTKREAGGRVLGAVGDDRVESPQVGGVADAGLGTLFGQLHEVATDGVVTDASLGVALVAAASRVGSGGGGYLVFKLVRLGSLKQRHQQLEIGSRVIFGF